MGDNEQEQDVPFTADQMAFLQAHFHPPARDRDRSRSPTRGPQQPPSSQPG